VLRTAPNSKYYTGICCFVSGARKPLLHRPVCYYTSWYTHQHKSQSWCYECSSAVQGPELKTLHCKTKTNRQKKRVGFSNRITDTKCLKQDFALRIQVLAGLPSDPVPHPSVSKSDLNRFLTHLNVPYFHPHYLFPNFLLELLQTRHMDLVFLKIS
jgi:hypothetical protein